MTAQSSERGSTPVELALGVALLLLPTMLLVLVLPTWVERQSMARVAAQEAARAAAMEGTRAAGERAAVEVAVNHGLDPAEVSVAWSGSLRRGGIATATVGVPVPAVRIPGLGSVGGFVVRAAHSEPVDRYGSGG